MSNIKRFVIGAFAILLLLMSYKLGAEGVRQEALDHGYGYIHPIEGFMWYEWDPSDPSVV